jgi:L-ribulose-5-phosphate 4-epimerase
MNNETDRAKQDLLTAAGRAYQIGIQTGNGGNLSCRVKDTDIVIIKPSGSSFGECTVDNLVTVNLQGEKTAGPGIPSREVYTHLAIYRKRPDVLGIFHCHSPWAFAFAYFYS